MPKSTAGMDPLMRALKALHSAGSPETMTPEELEHQRTGPGTSGPPGGALWRGWSMKSLSIWRPCLLPGPG